MIPLLQWCVYCCDGSDYILGWSGGRPIITSRIVYFDNCIATVQGNLSYFIPPDSQGVNFQSLFLFGRWVSANSFKSVSLATKKYYLSDY